MFFVHPQIVEPFNYTLLQMLRNLVKAHIGLNPVHLILEIHFSSILIGNYAADVSHNGSEEQNACNRRRKHQSVRKFC